MKDKLKNLSWRQLVVGAAAGWAAAHGVPPERAVEAVTNLLAILAPMSGQ